METEVATVDSSEKKEEDNSPAPVGNGGTTERYTWTQTLDELHVYIPVSPTLKSKEVSVKLSLQHLFVKIQDKVFIDQDFLEKINVDDSLWTLETSHDEKFIHISVQKWSGQMHWWESVLVGDPKINTQKINPENSKLSDLEGETRTTVLYRLFTG